MMSRLTPQVRQWLYAAGALLAAVVAIAYLILAVTSPDAAERLIQAIPLIVLTGLQVLAAVKVDTRTATGAPLGEELARQTGHAAQLPGVEDDAAAPECSRPEMTVSGPFVYCDDRGCPLHGSPPVG